MVLVKDVLMWLDAGAPFRYAEKWDQCGLQVGDPEAEVKRILVALDPSSETISEAEALGCQCLVTHHPLIFRPISTVRQDHFPGNLIIEALQNGIHLIAAHTNLDVARDGTNEHLARLLTVEVVGPLETSAAWLGEERYAGMGLIGILSQPETLEDFVDRARNALGGIKVRVVGDLKQTLRRIALCTGSGGSLVERAISSECDAYVTGDIKYHEAKRAQEAGIALIDIGHFASERLIVKPLAAYLENQAAQRRFSIEVFTAGEEQDPFMIL